MSKKCLICEKTFENYGHEVVCGPKCNYKYLTNNQYNIDDSVFGSLLYNILNTRTQVVKKGWGLESIIVNHDKYCFKYLIFFSGKKFSYHYHNIKQECWHCLVGNLDLILGDQDGNKKQLNFRCGSTIEIFPKQVHQLVAKENSIICEVSTRHFDEDSVRLVKGD